MKLRIFVPLTFAFLLGLMCVESDAQEMKTFSHELFDIQYPDHWAIRREKPATYGVKHSFWLYDPEIKKDNDFYNRNDALIVIAQLDSSLDAKYFKSIYAFWKGNIKASKGKIKFKKGKHESFFEAHEPETEFHPGITVTHYTHKNNTLITSGITLSNGNKDAIKDNRKSMMSVKLKRPAWLDDPKTISLLVKADSVKRLGKFEDSAIMYEKAYEMNKSSLILKEKISQNEYEKILYHYVHDRRKADSLYQDSSYMAARFFYFNSLQKHKDVLDTNDVKKAVQKIVQCEKQLSVYELLEIRLDADYDHCNSEECNRINFLLVNRALEIGDIDAAFYWSKDGTMDNPSEEEKKSHVQKWLQDHEMTDKL